MASSISAGIVYTIATRWTDRLVGLISTFILARLLAPDDFGIVAMASIAIGFADVILNLGVNVAIIQKGNVTKSDYDTAWTLRLLQTALSTTLIILAAPFIADYFKDSRVTLVLQLLSVTILLSGLENIGIVAYQKDMQFGSEFRFLFFRRIFGFVVTIACAWLWPSYWALIAGSISGRLIGVFLSYRMHPMRPSLSLSNFHDIFSISQWLLVNNVAQFLQNNFHKALVGRWSSSATMGAYSLADDIAAMPTGEVLAPINRVLFPAFSAAKDDHGALKRLFLLAQGVQTLIGVPAAVGLAAVAPEAVVVLLGEKWTEAVPFLQILAIMNVVQALTTSSGYALIALNKVRLAAFDVWLQLLFFCLLALTLASEASGILVAWIRLSVAVLAISLSFFRIVTSLEGLQFMEIISNVYRPIVSAAVMWFFVVQIQTLITLPLPALLAMKILAGSCIFIFICLTLWRFAGKPEGAEAFAISKIRAVLIGKHA